MNIFYCYNDGKDNNESFEVWSDLYPVHTYGSTKREAVDNYCITLQAHISQLETNLREARKPSLNLVPCRFDGTPLI